MQKCLLHFYAKLRDSETLQGRPGAVPFAVPMLSTRCALASFRDEHLDNANDSLSQSQYADDSLSQDEDDCLAQSQ